MRIKNTCLLGLAFTISVHAATIFDNSGTPQFQTVRTYDGIAAYLQIGSNITINQIGMRMQAAAPGQLKFVILSDIAPPGSDAGALLLSDSVNVSSTGAFINVLSDPLSFTFQAGHFYDVGAIFNGGSATYLYDLEGNTMNGITSIPNNENVGQFANPVLLGHGLADAEITLYANTLTIPEPTHLTSFGLLLVAGSAVVSRQVLRRLLCC